MGQMEEGDIQIDDGLSLDEGMSLLDEDLLDSEDAMEAPTSDPKQQAPLGRGRRKKRKMVMMDKETGPKVPVDKGRPFVESAVKQSLAKSDISETMSRWDWDSGDYSVAVKRVQPQAWHGRSIVGYIATYAHEVDEEFIRENHGGGVYDLVIRGPNQRSGHSNGFLDGCRVKISGDPIINPVDKNYPTDDGSGVLLANPQNGPASKRQVREAQEARDRDRRDREREDDDRGEGGMPGKSIRMMLGKGGNGRSMEDEPSIVKMSFDTVVKQVREQADENSRLRSQIIEQASSAGKNTKPDGSLDKELISILKESTDQVLKSERDAAERERKEFERRQQESQGYYEKMREQELKEQERYERLMERMSGKNGGIPPEMLQSMTEQHRSELNALQESIRTQLIQERENSKRELDAVKDRYESEIKSLKERAQSDQGSTRERHDAEVKSLKERALADMAQLRSEFQSRLEREQEAYKREIEHDRAVSREQLDRAIADWSKRFDDAQKDWARQITQERETSKLTLTNMEQRDRIDKESLINQQHMQIEHMKGLHDSQVRQLTSSFESQLAQFVAQKESIVTQLTSVGESQLGNLKSQYESQLVSLKSQYESQIGQLRSQAETTIKMLETSYTTRLGALESELTRTRQDLDSAKSRVAEQGDLASQAKKLKDVGESLQGVFGLGGPLGGLAPGSYGEDEYEEEEPRRHDDEPSGWVGTLLKFANSNIGKGALEFLKMAMMGGMGGGFPGGFPPNALPPGAFGPPQGMGPPPMVPQQQMPPQQQAPIYQNSAPSSGRNPYMNPGAGEEEEYEEEEYEEEGPEEDEEGEEEEIEEEPEEEEEHRPSRRSSGRYRYHSPAQAPHPHPQQAPQVQAHSQPQASPAQPPQPPPRKMESEVGTDGVVRVMAPQEPTKPRIKSQIGGDGVLRANIPQAPRPTMDQVGSGSQGGPVQQPPMVPAAPTPQGQPVMTQEISDGIKMLVDLIEGSIKNNAPPGELADIIIQMAPAETVAGIANMSIDAIVEQVEKVVPGSMLASYAGKKYLKQLQAAVQKRAAGPTPR